MSDTIRTDFFVIGAGAMGLAFADEILASTDLDVTLVDRRAGPGGHWNDAYDFVRLHQPAAYYGVNSTPLGRGGDDLVNKPELLAYFRRVIDRWRGRLRFMPQTAMGSDWRLRSLVSDQSWIVETTRPIVDASFSRIQVPATHPPKYAVSPEAALVPVGGLWRLAQRHRRYVVIGAGKTAFDALIYLMDHGVDPDRITWVISRDSWLYMRELLQPAVAGLRLLEQVRVFGAADSVRAGFHTLEARGQLARVDRDREPTMFRCATVDLRELALLRRVKDIVRLGRVQRVEPDRLVLDGGERPIAPGALFVDCTADGLVRHPPTPVFAADRITLQPFFVCQQVMSAAAAAAVFTHIDDDAARNRLTVPVPHPDTPADYVGAVSQTLDNLVRWMDVPWLGWWAATRRLSASSHMTLRDKLAVGLGVRRAKGEIQRALTALAGRG